jgi:hypothetical protein
MSINGTSIHPSIVETAEHTHSHKTQEQKSTPVFGRTFSVIPTILEGIAQKVSSVFKSFVDSVSNNQKLSIGLSLGAAAIAIAGVSSFLAPSPVTAAVQSSLEAEAQKHVSESLPEIFSDAGSKVGGTLLKAFVSSAISSATNGTV